MQNSAGRINDQIESDVLAEVIPLQGLDVPSFYQRNTGGLPRIGRRSSEINRRGTLPTPVNSDGGGGVFEFVKGLFTNH